MSAEFWDKVSKSDGCWLWTGRRQPNGYGKVGKSGYAHRVAWTLSGRRLMAGMTLDHLCRVRHCVNPDHLEQVTNRENLLRGVGLVAVNAAKDSCIRGHPFDESNTYRSVDGKGYPYRKCRACHRAETKRYKLKRRMA